MFDLLLLSRLRRLEDAVKNGGGGSSEAGPYVVDLIAYGIDLWSLVASGGGKVTVENGNEFFATATGRYLMQNVLFISESASTGETIYVKPISLYTSDTTNDNISGIAVTLLNGAVVQVNVVFENDYAKDTVTVYADIIA